MKRDSIFSVRNLIILLLVCLFAVTGVLFFAYRVAFYIVSPFVLILTVFAVIRLIFFQKGIHDVLNVMADSLDIGKREALAEFPMPVLVCSEERKILWYNEQFRSQVLNGLDVYDESIDILIKSPLSEFLGPSGMPLKGAERSYTVYGHCSERDGRKMYMLYFADNTRLVKISEMYKKTRPSVILILIDNYDEIFEDAKESVKSVITGAIDKLVEDWIGETNGFVRRTSRERFVAVVEEQHLNKMIEEKFSILEKARQILNENRMPVTLSLGVGHGARDLGESEVFARQALEMALGRGGDQAAVKTNSGFDFFGGMSKGMEKQGKVKTRIMASAICKLIEQSDNVILMGHKFGDLDSVGSTVGLAQTIRLMQKEAVVAVDYEKSLAKSLIDKIIEAGNTDLFVLIEEAVKSATPDTLLIITDTHNPEFLDSYELYEKCKNVVVIDHHRKMVSYINDAVIFYHEPYASSASEMVAELIQYMLGSARLGVLEAEGLLAGIMLDTKNFTLRTGVRTFEAAAYLRRLGADMVSVRRLFSNTIDSYQKKTKLVSSAEIYDNVAVAVSDGDTEDMRIVASQAADELLGISNVDASFVLYSSAGIVNISARSMGNMNVQVVMEELGGGGHQTMAGAQIPDVDIHTAVQMLLNAVDKHK